MTVDYRIYGLILRASRPLPHLPTSAADREPADPAVRFTTQGDSGRDAGDRLRTTISNNVRSLKLDIDPASGRAWANLTGEIRPETVDDVASLLAGHVLAGLLRLRGRISLHGSVLDVDSRATVLLGARGAGKSTIAAALAQGGAAVLSDDTAALVEDPDGGWTAEPGYPRLRMHPTAFDAINALAVVPPADGGPVFEWGEKRYLQLSIESGSGPWRFQPRALPVGAIYELHRDRRVDRPRVEPVRGADRLRTLVRHTRTALAPLSSAARAQELARLGRIANEVPVRRLVAPDDLEALPDVCRTITDDA